MARSMNQVAMNNVAQTKLLASVLLLDSLPLATELSLEDVTELEKGLSEQIRRGMPPIPSREREMLSIGLTSLRDRMVGQRDILYTMNESLKNFPMERQTHYSSSNGMGELWQASIALSELSQATVSGAGVLAQHNAVRWGKENGVPLRTAFITPIRPQIPAVQGTFADFCYPLGGRQSVYSTRATNEAPEEENLGMGGFVLGRKARQARVEAVLDIFPPLRSLTRRYAGTLSGGERKMVALARVLMSDPAVLLLDEPTAGLAGELTTMVLEQQVRLLAELGKAVVLVEQKAEAALRVADDAAVLVSGQIALAGSGAEILRDEQVGEIFLGGRAGQARGGGGWQGAAPRAPAGSGEASGGRTSGGGA